MKITCESCGAKYTIADDKVIGRKVKIRCKGCSTPIVVDGQKLGPSGAPPAGAEGKAETLLPQPSPDWSVNLSETDQRSMTTQQVVEGYQSGQITAEAYVWREGMTDWVLLLECAELAPLLAGAPAAAAPDAPLPPGYAEGQADPGAAANYAEPSPGYATPQAVYPAQPGFQQSGYAGYAPQGAADPYAAQAAVDPYAAQAADPYAAAPTPAVAAPVAEAVAAVPNPESATPSPAGEPGLKGLASEKATVRAVRARSGAQAKAETGSAPRSSVSARVTGGRSQGAQDLFAGVESAGAESLELPITGPSLPQAGSSAYADDRPTGARNENSVLFSLDSMKATNLSSSQGPHSHADDPFGMGGSTGVAGFGGGNPLFTLADNQRLLTAPPPPPEPPPRPVSIAVPSVGPGAPVALSRQMLGIIIGGVLLILLLGVGIGAALSGDDEKSELASATPEASSAPVADKGDQEKRDQEKKEEPAPAPAAEASAAAPSGEAKTASAEESAKGANNATGKGAAPGAKKDPKKDEAPTAAVADQPFNRGAAVAAMSAAASQAASCKKPGGPTGSGKASLTFAPTGRVTAATVDTAPFAGTAVGGCVASIFRRAKVPPFTGNPIRVSKSFTVP